MREIKYALKLFLVAAEMITGLMLAAWFASSHRYWTTVSSLAGALGIVLGMFLVVLLTEAWIMHTEMKER
jgi:hypothetical protein